jgi:glutamine amidotransferase
MAKVSVGMLDYGMGNLHSAAKAFEAAGARVKVSDAARSLNGTDLLVVPGQGRFDAAMKTLSKKGLLDFIKRWIGDQKPFFGICLGLQILFDSSEEAPGVKGLGLLPGRVKKFRGARLTVPHMGWNEVKWTEAGKPRGDYFYFVHSYYPEPALKSDVWARTPYGKNFCSAARRGSVSATQFHPEKSGEVGLRFLKKLLKDVP